MFQMERFSESDIVGAWTNLAPWMDPSPSRDNQQFDTTLFTNTFRQSLVMWLAELN